MDKHKTEQTITAYNRNAKRYNKKFTNFATYKKQLIAFQSTIPRGAKVLDLGCGPGNNIKTLLEHDSSIQITGIDLSTELLAIARADLPACNFELQDIRTWEPMEKYDVILASFCIVHLSHPETKELLKKISTALKNRGQFYLSFMEGKGSGFESTSFSQDEIYFNYYSVSEISSLLEMNNLTITNIETKDYPEDNGTITKDIFIFGTNKN